MELYKKHRPIQFKQIFGQDSAVKLLSDYLKTNTLPHCLLLSGPSGVGKTTIARILKVKLNCSDFDYFELNLADVRGIDEARNIRSQIGRAPMGGDCRIWLCDEIHNATRDFQEAMLKLLEDTPNHVYFFLATTRPEKLITTIRTRSTQIELKPLSPKIMGELLDSILSKEGKKLSDDVKEKIIELSDGSPRKALVSLDKVITEEDEEKQLKLLVENSSEAQAIELCRLFFSNSKATWFDAAKILKGIENLDEQSENIRWLVLSYASSVALKNPKMGERAYKIIDIFGRNFWDSKKAGLIAACYEVLHS